MSDIFEIAKSGILANQRALDLTGQNISNASNPEFSRRRPEFTEQGFRQNEKFAGLGVRIDDVTRLRSEILDERIRNQETDIGAFSEKNRVFKQLESVLATDTDGDLNDRLNAFFDSFRKLSAKSDSKTLRQNVVREAQSLTSTFNRIDNSFDEVRSDGIDRAARQVERINSLLNEVASFNESITSGEAEGVESDFASLDKRNAKLRELSGLAGVSITKADNESLTLRIGDMVVLQGDKVTELSFDKQNALQNKTRIRTESGKVVENIGGELGGIVEMVNEEIPQLSQDMDRLAQTVVEDVNDLHKNGFGLDNSTGLSFFDPDNTTAQTIQVNELIVNDTDKLAASDSINAPGNGEQAAAIGALSDADNAIDGKTITEFSIDTVSRVGTQINELETSIATGESALSFVENQQESLSGINIDEELANMIKFQNSFQASARVLNTAQTMFDSLLRIV